MTATTAATPSAGAPGAPGVPSPRVEASGDAAKAIAALRAVVAARSNGEHRPQQERLVGLIADGIANREHVVAQAGTGTGKTLSYLIPAILSGKRTVVCTATKQLGEQIVGTDLPLLAEVLAEHAQIDFTYTLLKGRANYLCKARLDELFTLDDQAADRPEDGLFAADDTIRSERAQAAAEMVEKMGELTAWADTTLTGDRTEAPPVPDRVWAQVSTDSAGCAGAAACPFGEVCFSEKVRQQAREATVVVTNHAQVALDLISPAPLCGEYDTLVVDEAHELESYLSSAWGLEVDPKAARKRVTKAASRLPTADAAPWESARDAVAGFADDMDALEEMLLAICQPNGPNGPRPRDDSGGRITTLDPAVRDLMTSATAKVTVAAKAMEQATRGDNADAKVAARRRGAFNDLVDVVTAINAMIVDTPTVVRWLEAPRGSRGPTLKSAPIEVGDTFIKSLASRTLIATSATLTVNGSFEPFKNKFSLDRAGTNPTPDADTSPDTTPGDGDAPAVRFALAALRNCHTLDAGTPFTYDTQAMLYVPGNDFPAPVGSERTEHTAAVTRTVTDLCQAAGGRTLALFTTRAAAERVAAHLRRHLDVTVLCQGDAPNGQLVETFRSDETSVLCATMGMWQGLDVPGPALTQVIMDKIPFAPMNDPLLAARRELADSRGNNGFTEVFVHGAAIAMAQGTGRLIRTATDRGVVAILDPRLRTKGYGRTLLGSLPPMRSFTDPAVVTAALQRLTGTPAK